jgi:HEAT repeat protein
MDFATQGGNRARYFTEKWSLKLTIDYSKLSNQELIRRFVQGAIRYGSASNFALKMDYNSEEGKAVKKEIKACGEELAARKPIDELRPLFEHENPDVRAWAGGQFLGADPEWASATLDALHENLTTKEVLELTQRALKKPPIRPTLQEMSIEQLVARFEDASIRAYATRFLSDENGGIEWKQRNRIIDEMGKIIQELDARNARKALVSLFDRSNLIIRYFAAEACLPFASERAIPIIEDVVASKDQNEATFAARILQEWRGSSTATAVQ